MSMISRVLSSKYIRSELFRHVSLIHRQLGITNVFHSSDVVSLYHCVLCGDTAKFIHHCDQLDISIHSPQELLDTIKEAFKHAMCRMNHRLVTYVIERFRQGSNTSSAQFVKYVREELISFDKHQSQYFKFSHPMIHTVLGYLKEIDHHWIAHNMMRSALADHDDGLDLCVEIAPFQTPGCPAIAANLVNFAIKQRLIDLLVWIAEHVDDARVPRELRLPLKSSSHPVSIDSLKNMMSLLDRTPLFNRLAKIGDVRFMKHVHHLVADYIMTNIIKDVRNSGPLFDNTLLQCALTGGHYDCALYILDNISQFLPLITPPSKWIVSGINMVRDPNHHQSIIQLIDMLINHDSVDHNFKDLYTDAIKARRMDVIDLVEQLISNPGMHSSIVINIDQALNVALQEKNMDAINKIIGSRPGHVFKNIKLMYIDQLSLVHQDMFLDTVPPERIVFNMDGPTSSTCARLTASTIRMMIKHDHHHNCHRVLLQNAEFLDEMELIKCLEEDVANHDRSISQYPWLSWKNVVNVPRFDSDDRCQNQIAYILHDKRLRCSKIDKILYTLQHLDRVDVSLFDKDVIEFIWPRLINDLKQDDTFILHLLSSNAVANNIIFYRYILDRLIEANHFQMPFIPAPTMEQIKDNIKLFKRYSSIRLIVEMFTPSTTSPYHRLLVPLTQSEFQQYQSLLINLGVFNPSHHPTSI
ncbi:hypothetical protein SAMD00019534_093020 [Acytostelium subglobosum LB1]|uniref:hypothetical protein n=1 Tax=Acytostelium subglobosum LB1 TaxID=1410327 RepID=UPI000644B4EA|nr:hypothetical protein SAMD00019534_093020 [Acytostelium subglobosum LB1]GAM26127.1 hypothetical protein SAMD00019534_093020 [Acytostelium subglobosum LB1]|eukprot:XP_012751170.1 hypothetical protein SAMD00019534_093020 [Acytostelium subglobosum LB1]